MIDTVMCIILLKRNLVLLRLERSVAVKLTLSVCVVLGLEDSFTFSL